MPTNFASKTVQRLEWKGKKISATMSRAEARAAGFIIFKSVLHAKRNHPGWKKITGKANKSIRKISLTREGGDLVGKWGSTLFYVRFLEIYKGAFLRNAGDVWYPKLAGKIGEFFREMS